MDRIRHDRGHELAGSLEEQCARCEEAIAQEMCSVLSALQDELSEDMSTAFAHLAAGTYGFCSECHHAIPIARLDALPFATRCDECDTRQERPRRPEVLVS
jgi:hypothetical protein